MLRALNTAATGLEAQQLNVDVIANNLANVNTTGFKRSRADFADLLYAQLREPGSAVSQSEGLVSPTGIQVGHGVRSTSVSTQFTVGAFQQGNGALDIAIEDQGQVRGFIQVQLPSGLTAYTRDGTLQINADGEIVTSTGYKLSPAISGVPDDYVSIQVGTDGTIQAIQANNASPVDIGQIELASFINPAGLRAYGSNFWLETEASGAPTRGNPGEDQFGAIRSGFLESSNVEAVRELVSLITAQRAYEMNSRVIQTADEMLQTTATLRR